MAVYTVSNTGGNINAGGTYVGGVTPSSTDDIVFTATSGDLTVNTTFTIAGFDLTNFVGTITFTALLNVSGNLNLGTGGYTQAGANGIVKTGTGSITSNGTTWSRFLKFQGIITVTLADILNLSGTLCFQINGNPDTTTLNGFQINHSGGLLAGATSGAVTGTTDYYYTGTGTTFALGSVVQTINIDFYLNGSGNFAITGSGTGGFTLGGTKEFKVLSGALVTSSLTHFTITGNRTLDFGGYTVNGLRFTNTTMTVTLLSNTTCNTLYLFYSTTIVHTINGFSINATNITQTFTATVSTANTTGTTNINFIGTGTWSNSGVAVIKNNITFKSTCSTTLSGTLYYNTGTISDEFGSSVTATGNVLSFGVATTFNTTYTTFNTLVLTAATYTLNATLLANLIAIGTAGTTTFNGTNGFTIGSLSCTVAGKTLSFATGKTYTVTTDLTITGTAASKITFSSSSTHANFILQAGATQSVTNCNATNINSSAGQTINTSAGTLTSTINWSIGGGNFFLMF
jgi:hypothetical protein